MQSGAGTDDHCAFDELEKAKNAKMSRRNAFFSSGVFMYLRLRLIFITIYYKVDFKL
jgi:hypothetical protein